MALKRLRAILVVLGLAATGLVLPTSAAWAGSTPTNAAGITTTVDPGGAYTITSTTPAWTFSGNIGHALGNIAVTAGSDRVGTYREIGFTWTSTAGASRSAAIRSYDSKPVVLFTDRYLTAAGNIGSFPSFSTWPQNPYHLSYAGTFSQPTFSSLTSDGPWTYFDGSANAFILSPASHFQQAYLTKDSSNKITSGIIPGITSFPAGFTQQTVLVIQPGITAAYDTYGHALTDLQGKTRPANDADVDLNKFGYWTDNGAAYYYTYDTSKGYTGTLLAVRDQYAAQGIPLGYMQLDSWWYPKGPNADWTANANNGLYTYTAAPQLFPNGLAAFQQQLGLPLVTHSRWIDAASPYRGQYTISNNVATDPRWWSDIMGSIHSADVIRYEQDWMSQGAQPTYNLTDPDLYLDNMANAAKNDGMTLQYCMALPKQFLQTSKYSNVTTMRVSDDRFERAKWHGFLYTSQLAASMGDWPWVDVFKSNELDNLTLATLSAGMVGVGDALGTIDKANIMQSIRTDGVIVKPDVPIVPTDAGYLNDAKGLNLPVVGQTYSDFGAFKAHYVFAYNQNSTNVTASFTPASLGMSGSVYVYNTNTGIGTLQDASATYSENVGSRGYGYYVAVPVGASGVGFLGDAGKIASLGKKRISAVSDDGTLHATVQFAPGEGAVTLHGYAASSPQLTMTNGTAGAVSYNASTHQFAVTVNAAGDHTATLDVKAGSGTTSTWYEAERATLSGPVVATEQTGYSGSGYADYQNASNDYVDWTVNVTAAGNHTLAVRYANAAPTDRPLALTVDGAASGANLSFPSTGSWTTWSTATRVVNLTAGTHHIRLTATGASGANIDRLELT